MTSDPSNLQDLSTPPGSLGLPFLGETLNFLFDSGFAKKKKHQHGRVFKTHIFGSPSVFMIGAEANQFIFANENKYFDVNWPPSTQALLGTMSLSMQSGHTHSSRRKLLAQAFQPRALASYTPTIAEITKSYLSRWQQMGNLTWYPEIRNYTFDVASTLLLSIPNGSQTELGQYFHDWSAGLFSTPVRLPWTAFGKAMRSRDLLRTLIDDIVTKRQTESEMGHDALGILLQAKDEEGNGLSLQELEDQLLTLLFAGHETLTSAISSFCLLISQHPEVCDRARDEQLVLMQSNPEINPDTLKQMPYLDAVMKEVLRFIPPVGGGFRKVKQDFEFQGYRIPAGWQVLYQITQSHREENLYDDPDTFNPDRFLETKQQLFSYLPFGGGLRECLGKEYAKLEMKIFGAMLLRHYHWELLPNQDLTLVTVPTSRPRDGLKINFHQR